MDLRDYYREIAKQEAAIEESYALIISCKTSNGGREGIMSEVTRSSAARMIVEKKARLASPEEVAAHRDAYEKNQRQKQLDKLHERLRLTAIAQEELQTLKLSLFDARKTE